MGTLARVYKCKTSWCDLVLTFDLAVVTLTYNALSGLYFRNHKVFGSLYLVGTLVGGYMCATSWCDLDLTFDLAYLMLFYLSTGISNTILSLLYLLLDSWLLHLWVSFDVD